MIEAITEYFSEIYWPGLLWVAAIILCVGAPVLRWVLGDKA